MPNLAVGYGRVSDLTAFFLEIFIYYYMFEHQSMAKKKSVNKDLKNVNIKISKSIAVITSDFRNLFHTHYTFYHRSVSVEPFQKSLLTTKCK